MPQLNKRGWREAITTKAAKHHKPNRDELQWDPVNCLWTGVLLLVAHTTALTPGHPWVRSCQNISRRPDSRALHSFIQELQSHVAHGENSLHRSKLWSGHCRPEFKRCRCLDSCRHILSCLVLLSFRSPLSAVHRATTDHTHTKRGNTLMTRAAYEVFRKPFFFCDEARKIKGLKRGVRLPSH